MAEQIISASGPQYGLVINSDGSINSQFTGSVFIDEVIPTDPSQNNPYYNFKYIISGTSTGVTGSEIGSIVQFIGAGSFVKVFTWLNDLIINIGSWS